MHADRPAGFRRGDTASFGSDADQALRADACDQLFVVMSGERPLAPPTRHLLQGIDQIELGRAETAFDVARNGRRLRIAVADRRVSSRHALITRTPAGWVIEDAGSKNGTFVAGERLTAAVVLADATPCAIGTTWLMLRAGCRVIAPLDVDGAEALATMSPALGQAFHDLVPIAAAGGSILIEGETGTGKERVARAIHAITRRAGDLVAVNCGALPPPLAVSELFGAMRGSFSGAATDRVGLIASADGGTLFLDEVGELPAEAQPILLRVLQEREVLALGANRPRPIDLRVISATNRDLAVAVAAGDFRADLHARIAGFTLALPPLRARREDLGLIVAELIRRHAADPHRVTLSRGALAALFAYGWPQNVRELESAITVALSLARDGAIGSEHLPPAVRGERQSPQSELDLGLEVAAIGTADGNGPDAIPVVAAPAPAPAPLGARRAAELMRLLALHGGNIAAVARDLGRQRSLVHRWLRRYGIDASQFRR
jgi:sigma-54 dependent transcriptional regulator, acetoin dehydrogenase operon transcriptional activator AcoR